VWPFTLLHMLPDVFDDTTSILTLRKGHSVEYVDKQV